MRYVQVNIVQVIFKLVIVSVLALTTLMPAVSVSAEHQPVEFPELISVSADGETGDGNSFAPQISNDGRYVAYVSQANNLGGQRTDVWAVYVYDRIDHTTTLATVNSDGEQENGDFIPTSGLPRRAFALSGDGRHVAFRTNATNLDPSAAGVVSLYVHDLDTGVTNLASVDNDGQAIETGSTHVTSISDDGNLVAFESSFSSPLGVSAFIRDMANGLTTELINGFNNTRVSGDGSRVIFRATDGQGVAYDRTTGEYTVLGNVGSVYREISTDGRYVSFPNGRWDTSFGEVVEIDTFSGAYASMSSNGSTIAISSSSGQLHIADYDIGGPFGLVNAEGEPVYGGAPSLNGDGSLITFAGTGSQIFVMPTGFIKTTEPTEVTSVTIDNNPKAFSQTAELTAEVTGGQGGAVNAEYYIGIDPGQGSATPMTFNGTTATAQLSVGSDFPAGMYTVYVRAQDGAGNWSEPLTINLDVYDPEGGYAAGHGSITPNGATSDPGDFLPEVTGNQLRAAFDFTVKYDGATSTSPTGSSAFTWGFACNRPNNDCFVIEMDLLSLLVVPTDSSTAVFQGLATLSLGGQSQGSNFPVKVSVTGGTGGSQAHYLLQVYDEGVNPNSGPVFYQASGNVTGNIVIHK